METPTNNELLTMRAWQTAMKTATDCAKISATFSVEFTSQVMAMAPPALAKTPAWGMATAWAMATSTTTAMITAIAVSMPMAMMAAMAMEMTTIARE